MAAAADPRTGRIYVFGGRDQDGRLLNEIVEYAPSMGSIGLSLPRLPSGRFNLAATANATTGTIFCVGGEALNVFRLDEILEFQTQTQPQTVKLQVGDTGDGTAALANSWNVFSSRNFKRNIQTLAPDELANVLAKVQATDVVRYVSKNDHQNTPRLGVIAEESPKEILGPGGKSISLSDYNAFLLAAIKAQQAEIEKNEEQIDALGTRFRELKKSKAESSGLGLDGSHPWLTALLLLVATVIFWQDWKRNPRPWSRSMMLLLAAAIVATALTASHAQQFDLSWYSIDGGGVIGSTDGQFTMSSTIGQPDAGAVMTGGGFEMIGGFWAGAGPSCACVSDLNADGLRNGGDIQDFIECLLTAGPNCTCADVRTDGILDLTDVEQFVGTLLDGSSCP